MKMIRFIILIAVLVLLTNVAFAAGHGNMNASGDWYYLPTGMVLDKMVGGNQFVSITDVGYWTGTIAGTETDVGSAVIYRSGRWSYSEGILTFPTAVVDGKTGSLVIWVHGFRPDVFTDWQGQWMITEATGELEGLHGQGTWSGPGYQLDKPTEHGVVSYTGHIHFKP